MPESKIEQIKEFSRHLAAIIITLSLIYFAMIAMLNNMTAISSAQRAFLAALGPVGSPLPIVVSFLGLLGVLWFGRNFTRLLSALQRVSYLLVKQVI